MRLEIHLLLPAEARLLSRTRQTVAGFLAEVGAADQHVDDVVLALDEACANAIRHGASGDSDGAYELHAVVTPEEVVIEVTDDGPGLRPERVDVAPVPVTSTSGRGLHLIRALMDDVTVGSAGEGRGTVVRMARTLD